MDGTQYTGEWLDDMRHGHGLYYFANGDRYEGGWVDDDKSNGRESYFYVEGA